MQNISRATYFCMHQNASCVDSQQRQSLKETACINMLCVSLQCPFCMASISLKKKIVSAEIQVFSWRTALCIATEMMGSSGDQCKHLTSKPLGAGWHSSWPTHSGAATEHWRGWKQLVSHMLLEAELGRWGLKAPQITNIADSSSPILIGIKVYVLFWFIHPV